MARADLIVDGLLGIGGRGGLREPFAGLAAAAAQARAGPAGPRPSSRSTCPAASTPTPEPSTGRRCEPT